LRPRGVDRALPLHDGAPDVPYDVDCEIMELPHALRASAETIPRNVPYLLAESSAPIPATLAEESRARVGIVWRAGDWAPHRSIPVDLVSPLSFVSNIRLFSLQGGPAQSEARPFRAPRELRAPHPYGLASVSP